MDSFGNFHTWDPGTLLGNSNLFTGSNNKFWIHVYEFFRYFDNQNDSCDKNNTCFYAWKFALMKFGIRCWMQWTAYKSYIWILSFASFFFSSMKFLKKRFCFLLGTHLVNLDMYLIVLVWINNLIWYIFYISADT